MAISKGLLVAGLMFSAGIAEAQKNPAGETPEAPTATPAPTEAPAPAATATVTASDPQSIVNVMQAEGYTAALGVDNVGDPMITSEIGGATYAILFYGCTENANCQWLQFQASFDLPNGWTTEAANEWNTSKILTDASVDAQMDPVLEFFVTTTGGLTEANFADVVDWWRVMLDEFKTTIGA